MTIPYHLLPAHMQDSARAYIERGQCPGDFMLCVLCNDLTGAARRADDENKEQLFCWACWLYEIPGNAWGSLEKVETWIESHRKLDRT